MGKNIELNIRFLQRLQGNDGVTEISDLTHNLWGIEVYENAIKTKKDLYFATFEPSEKWFIDAQILNSIPRTKNEHIWKINHFRADFDVRSYVYEHENGRILTDTELYDYLRKLISWLDSDSLLRSYSTIVHSGNGFHVYRIWKFMEISPKAYAAASRELYNKIKKVFPTDPYLRPDYACSNIGRLMRLPGSWNCKQKYGLPPQEVKILKYNEEDSALVEKLGITWEVLLEEEAKKIERHKVIMRRKCESRVRWFWENELFNKINNIPISELVCDYTWWTLTDDGVNYISNRDGKYTGAFNIPEENIVIHMGTPHMSDYFKAYSPFAFLMIHYGEWDAKKTFEVAKELYPKLNEKTPFYFDKTWLEWESEMTD